MVGIVEAVSTVDLDNRIAELEQLVIAEKEKTARAVHARDLADRAVVRIVEDKDAIAAQLAESLSVKAANANPPTWTKKKTRQRTRHATPTIFLSDTHWGEVVRPEEINGYNAYSTPIAEQRLQRVAEGVVTVTDMISLTYDGIMVPLGGDMFSGSMHRELDRTNDMEQEEGIIHWTGQMLTFLTSLADHYGKVHVPAFVGNHGRSPLDRKMPGKRRARTNQDWLLYQNLALHLRGDDRFTWQISESQDALYNVYDTTYLGYHGNDFNGGNGISGIFTPVMLGKHRTGQQYRAFGKSFHWMHIGHFHQHIVAKGLIVNGSMKGYDEFANMKRYEPEVPSQAMWITTPEHGLTFSMPVFCADAEAEGWADVQEVAP